MYIKGAGMTKFGLQTDDTNRMIYEASFEALEQADMGIDDIDAIVVSNIDIVSNGERQRHASSYMSSIFNKKIPIIRVPAGCAGSGVALWTALKMEYDNMLVLGYEKLVANTTSNVTDEILMGGERIYEQAEGMNFPAQNALVAQQHMSRFGTTSDDLALVALKNHENGSKNPKAAFYKKNISLEQIKNSQIVASPLRLFDCSYSVNGAAACIISKDKSDIEIIGSGMQTDYLAPFERPDMTTWQATVESANIAFSQAKIERSDINFAEIHDAFTIVEIISYEDLGFAKKGQGVNMIRDGATKIDGRLPVNTCGGLKAKGHPISATGLAQIYEIAKQMRHEAEDRQLAKTKYALAQNIGGAGSTVAVHILKKISG